MLYWSSCLLGGKSPNTLWCETTHAYKPFGYIVWKIWKNVFSLVTFLEIFPVKLPVNSNSGSSAVKTEDNKQNNIVLIMEFPPFPQQFFASPLGETTLRTDSELGHRGFHIEVSSSCTVIRHILRGTPLFVGTIFTNAPVQSAAVARLQGFSDALNDEE